MDEASAYPSSKFLQNVIVKNTKGHGHTLLLINFGRGERISENTKITQINNPNGSYKPKYPRAHDETLKRLVENLETHPYNSEEN